MTGTQNRPLEKADESQEMGKGPSRIGYPDPHHPASDDSQMNRHYREPIYRMEYTQTVENHCFQTDESGQGNRQQTGKRQRPQPENPLREDKKNAEKKEK